ncbi:MAG: alpha-2-macroglobulin [Pseudomonadota bacterium]
MNTLKMMTLGLIVLFFCSTASADNEFKTRFAGQQTIDDTNCIAVTFSMQLDSKQNLNTYFSIFTDKDIPVEGAWVLAQDLLVVYFTNILPDTPYTIKIHKGLKSATGSILETAGEYQVRTRAVQPMISFDSNGFILASKLSRGLPVNTLNIDMADIDFFRVKPDFYDQFSRQYGQHDRMDYYSGKNLKTCADLVYSGRWDLEIKKDLRTLINIPITHIQELARPGIYFAVLRGAGLYDYSYSTTWFTISDLGLHIKTYQNLIQAHVQSLETAQPLNDVTIEGFDKDGRILVNTRTDNLGLARIKGKVNRLKYMVARSKNNITFVPMDMPAIDLSEFKTATEPFRPVDLFVYGPRDLYRPGETIVLDGLLRDHDGRMTPGLPVPAMIIQPDGRTIHEFTFKGSHLNHYHYEYVLPKDAITGRWRIQFNHSAGKLKEYEFTVAEFLPERMKLTLENPQGLTDILNPLDTPTIELRGDFLYGAPAFGSKADAAVHVKPARELFKERWPGYEFGDITNEALQSFKTDQIVLDETGKGKLTIKNQWEDTKSPLSLTANVSLYDSGGRPVVRTKSWQIWPNPTLVGIRALAQNDQVDDNGIARFEIIMVDNTGKQINADGLKVIVIREHREYYWEYRNDTWQWQFTSQPYPIDRFELDIPQDSPAKVNIPVKWGGYRLEITHPQTGLVSSRRIWAGWHPDSESANGGANRPDRVDLVLDKPVYQANDKANVTIKAPEGGSGYLFIESDTNLLTIPVTVPKEGKTIEFTIDPSWDRHDLHLSALIIRKGENQTNNQTGLLPKRAVGLIHLPLDRTFRKLSLKIDAPEKIEPNQTIETKVVVRHADNSIPETTWVTLAAVDVGILNLTGFKTPAPHDYFFQKRKYSVQIHDVYQRLIEVGKGAWATQRFGGDAPSLSRGGDRPSTDVQIVALSKNAVQVDKTGTATFHLDIPDFNGSLRLMAIAHTTRDFGSSEQEITIAAPLVTQITMPRFLAMGDRASLVIDLHNMTEENQTLSLNLSTSGPVSLAGKTSEQLTLEPGKKSAILFPVFAAQQLGQTKINLSVDGLVTNGIEKQVNRTWDLDIRPAYPAITRMFRKQLKPSESFALESRHMGKLITETIDIQAMISSTPLINIFEHVRQLNVYPYGCLEQVTSGIFPHVILSSSDFNTLGLSNQTPDTTSGKIRLGIQRLMEKQKSSGGFGLWSAKDMESYWLTCYVADFLLHARQAGYEVPKTALSKALERLKTYVLRPNAIHTEPYYNTKGYSAAVRVYAAFVLARVQGISLGDARAVYQSVKDDIVGALGFVHAGLALTLTGDQDLGPKVITQALTKSRNDQTYYADYGSNVRDFAVSCYLVSTFYPAFKNTADFMFLLQDELDKHEWLSTQERNALVLAGSISLKENQKTWQADIKTGDSITPVTHAGIKQITSLDGESATGFEIKNTGSDDLYLSVIMTGFEQQKPEPVSKGVQIKRRYLTLAGEALTKEDETQFKSGDRLITELLFSADQRMPNCLIADLLAAGLELEDPNLSGATIIDDIKVDNKTVAQWHSSLVIRHTEYRDDRFVAALDIQAKQTYRIFYPIRVVSPGSFLVPPPLVEDMVKPYIRAIGDVKPLITITNP